MANRSDMSARSRGAEFASELELDKAHRDRARSTKPLRRIWPFVAKYPGLITLFAICMLIAVGLGLAIAPAIQVVADCGFSSNDTRPDYCRLVSLGENANRSTFFILAIAIVVGNAVFGALRFYYVSVLGQRVIADLRKAVYDHLTTLSSRFFETVHSGEVQSRLTTDTILIETVIGSSLSFALRTILSSLGAILLMFFYSMKLTLAVVAIGPFIILIAVLFGRRVQRLSRSSQDSLADASVRAGESISAMQTVQAFSREKIERANFGRAIEATFIAHKRRLLVRSWMTFFIFATGMAGMLCVAWLGALLVGQGELTPGGIIAFAFLAFTAVSGVGFLTNTYTDFLRAAGATERIMELLSEEPDIKAPESPKQLGKSNGQLAFDDVSFAYPSRPDQQALHNVSLDVQPGQTVALVGPSGAGKSTVYQLLLRFFDVQDGSVSIDGLDVRDLDPAELRNQFAIVQQNTPLFSGSAMDNIRYGRSDASDEDVIAAAKAAYAHDFIMALPDGYDTQLGEDAATLSGGQRQRIAIARAILRDAPILLLDEATSALDSESEVAVQKAFEQISKDRTSLVIAHRLSTVRSAEHILVFDKGEIVERGTHDELLTKKGVYARLAKLQFSVD